MTLKTFALCLVLGCMAMSAATLGFTVVGATLFVPEATAVAAVATADAAADRRKRVFDERARPVRGPPRQRRGTLAAGRRGFAARVDSRDPQSPRQTMRIGIVGAGPAGLLFALLAKRRRPDASCRGRAERGRRDLRLRRRVLARRARVPRARRAAMHARSRGDGDVADAAHRASGRASTSTATAFPRSPASRCCSSCSAVRAGRRRVEFGRTLESLAPLADCDLVVGADGVNSLVRRSCTRERFQPRIEWLTNKFAWYGTTQAFDCLTLTFRENEHGTFVAHHYRYAPDDEHVHRRMRRGDLVPRRARPDERRRQSRAYCERVFAPDLDGHPLISNRSIWRNFPLL